MWKVILALVLLAVAAATGYYYGSGQKEVVVEKGETITVVKDRIITKIVERKPDGTIVETVKEEEINHETSSTTSSNTTKKAGPDYRVGASYWVGSVADVLGRDRATDGLGLSASRRIVGPVWVDAEVRPFGKQEVAIGVSVTW